MLRKYDHTHTNLPPGATVGIISLSNGKWALVDSSDFAMITKWRWTWKRSHSLVYAVRKIHVNGREVLIRMHRQVMGNPKGMHIHHSNGNTLDNRKCNLAALTEEQHKKIHNRI